MRQWTKWVAGVLMGIGLVTAGCASPPKDDDGGREPVGTTTRSEKKDPRPRTADLIETSDQVAMQLAADLNRLAKEDFGGYRVTLILGDISNKSGIVPIEDFELIQTRIKDKLLQSSTFRDNIKVEERRQRIERLNEQEMGDAPEEDLLQANPVRPSRPDRNPQYTFYLLGDVYGVHRHSTHLYYLSFKLNRASDGEEVFSKQYEVKYDVPKSKRHSSNTSDTSVSPASLSFASYALKCIPRTATTKSPRG